MEKCLSESIINDNFEQKPSKDKLYHIHSEIDLWINITITEILNYNDLLSKELREYIKSNKKYNYNNLEEKINNEKFQVIKKIIEGSGHEKLKNKEKNNIISYENPNCELYFIVKLFVDDIERKPGYQTKIIFNTKNINQHISFKFKYKDLSDNSYIIIEIYSVELQQKYSFLGKSKIFLFDKNLNLCQGRHAIKIEKKTENREEKLLYTEIEKEIDLLINSFYGKEFNYSENYYGEGEKKEGIKIKDSKIKLEEIKNNYFYNSEKKEPQMKTELIKNYEWKLKYLLERTNSSFIVIRLPSFNYQIIYEEEISKDYKEDFVLSENDKIANNLWINDASIYKGKNYLLKDNPLTEKFELLSQNNIVDLAKDIRLNPLEREKINNLLNTPDFKDLGKDKDLFWKSRYELLRNDTHFALTKIMNSVDWNNKENYKEFIKNILKPWKTIEICDILYILSRKFSLNKDFMETKINDLTGLKSLRQFAVDKLDKLSIKELNFILLQLVQAIKYEDISLESFHSPLVKLLVKKSKENINFATAFYWFIECESFNENNQENIIASIFNKIKEYFIQEMNNKQLYLNIINNQIEFKNELEDISQKIKKINSNKFEELLSDILDIEKKEFMHNTEHCLPIEPEIQIKGICSGKCIVFKSAKRPIKYTFKIKQENRSAKYNHFGDEQYYELIFKSGDDLRQDQLILQIINFMDSLLKSEHIDCEFTTYKILATSKSGGFVEFVPNSTTYYDIIKKYNTLENKFKEQINNPEEYQKKIEKFINSLAGYCAVNYILGIGDRHNENVMFRNNGNIFHIDFGYILCNEPNFFSFIPFKISKDMVNCMGGKKSDNYRNFKQKCVNTYLLLRENARTIINMFYLMIDSGIPLLNDYSLENLIKQFAQGLTKEQAKDKFLKELEDSINSPLSEIKEKFHQWRQDYL